MPHSCHHHHRSDLIRIVTGCSDAGHLRTHLHPLAKGRMEAGTHGLEVGHQLRVKLVLMDVERGFIDFVHFD